jgi:hypothetical protein
MAGSRLARSRRDMGEQKFPLAVETRAMPRSLRLKAVDVEEATLLGFDVAGIGNASRPNDVPDADADHAYLAALR